MDQSSYSFRAGETAVVRRITPERVAVCAAFFANGFFTGSWATQIPMLAARLNIDNTVLGTIILLFGLGAIGTMPLVGGLIGRLGSRRIMITGGVLLALGLPSIASAPGLWAVAVAAAYAGATTGSMDVAMNANAVALEKRLPFAIMSSCHGFWSLGGLAGASVGGVLIATLGTLGHALLVGGVILLLIALVVRRALEDRGSSLTAAKEESTAVPSDTDDRGSTSSRPILIATAVGLFALLCMVPEGAVLDWGAIFVRRDLGVSVALSGFAFASFSLSMAAFRFAGDGLRDRFGAVRVTRFSTLAAAAGLVVAACSVNLAMACLGFALMGVGVSNLVPIAFSAAGNVRGLRPGVGLGIVSTVGYSGILLAPAPIGYLTERIGFPTVFIALSVLLVGGFFSARLLGIADRPQP
ncbi:MFS transporter [Consotaella salsifontis]|uniref:Fucose permease n=1 Tax=Consotaella salsifontis TaxID=1365950 RepID=A0A1T4SQJ3_9HYPH|nr:MFS transporter [Consotaella salsifontis]SKA30550.1 Fucose permease [Consotaella salsifontis]